MLFISLELIKYAGTFCFVSITFSTHQAKAEWIRVQRTKNIAEIAVSFRLLQLVWPQIAE